MRLSDLDQRIEEVKFFDENQDYVERLVAERDLYRDIVIETGSAYSGSFLECESSRLRDAGLIAASVRSRLSL